MPPARLALYAATVGVLATTAFAVLRHPPPFVASALLLAGYAGLLAAGVFVPRLRVFADAVARGPRGARGVALTFDGGPDARWTPRVLELLAQSGAKATFFLVASRAEQCPEVVRAILDGGHAVGLQSYAADRRLWLRGEDRVRRDLERGVEAFEAATGLRPPFFRPPAGRTSPAVARVAEALDLPVVGWSLDARDAGASAKAEDVAARVRRDLRDRAIVALHDAPGDPAAEPASVRALPMILAAMDAERLEAVPLTAWIASDRRS